MSAPNVLYGRLQQAELRSSFGVQIGTIDGLTPTSDQPRG